MTSVRRLEDVQKSRPWWRVWARQCRQEFLFYSDDGGEERDLLEGYDVLGIAMTTGRLTGRLKALSIGLGCGCYAWR